MENIVAFLVIMIMSVFLPVRPYPPNANQNRYRHNPDTSLSLYTATFLGLSIGADFLGSSWSDGS